jgi:hypothetical protein
MVSFMLSFNRKNYMKEVLVMTMAARKINEVQAHLNNPRASGFTIKTATTTMDVRGPKNGFWSIHLYQNGRLVQKSETRTDAVVDKIHNYFDADKEVPDVYRYYF